MRPVIFAIVALALSAPAAAMPNAFWIFGFEGPLRQKPAIRGIADRTSGSPVVVPTGLSVGASPAVKPVSSDTEAQLQFDINALASRIDAKAP